jgi:hypothetical protein
LFIYGKRTPEEIAAGMKDGAVTMDEIGAMF